MALAAALQHSAGPKVKVQMQQNGAPREQKTAARAVEVEEQVAHGLRAQKTPPPGARPGILAEPRAQRSDRSRRHFSGDRLPTLGLPVLAGALGEQVASSALRFLTASALESKRKLEEEEEVKRQQEARMKAAKVKEKMEKHRVVAATGSSSSSVGPIRPASVPVEV